LQQAAVEAAVGQGLTLRAAAAAVAPQSRKRCIWHQKYQARYISECLMLQLAPWEARQAAALAAQRAAYLSEITHLSQVLKTP
jgi:hypothetical protein